MCAHKSGLCPNPLSNPNPYLTPATRPADALHPPLLQVSNIPSSPATVPQCRPTSSASLSPRPPFLDALFVRIGEADKKKFAGFIGDMRSMVTDGTIRVRSLYCPPTNVKSYVTFFLDTNNCDAIPDVIGERRFFIVRCNEERVGYTGYFDGLRNAINDDSVIRALFDFLMARDIKPMYLGSDIPIGPYQKELKNSHRTLTERFLESWTRDQPFASRLAPGSIQVNSPTKVSLKSNELCDEFREWQKSGGESDRSNSSIVRELTLKQIPGIKKSTKQWKNVTNAETGAEEKKQVTRYEFDLEELRKRYEISIVDDGNEAPADHLQVAPIACNADVEAWEQLYEDGGEAGDGSEDEDEDEDEDDHMSQTERASGRKRQRSSVAADSEDDDLNSENEL